jgi:hypothetical protein
MLGVSNHHLPNAISEDKFFPNSRELTWRFCCYLSTWHPNSTGRVYLYPHTRTIRTLEFKSLRKTNFFFLNYWITVSFCHFFSLQSKKQNRPINFTLAWNSALCHNQAKWDYNKPLRTRVTGNCVCRWKALVKSAWLAFDWNENVSCYFLFRDE